LFAGASTVDAVFSQERQAVLVRIGCASRIPPSCTAPLVGSLLTSRVGIHVLKKQLTISESVQGLRALDGGDDDVRERAGNEQVGEVVDSASMNEYARPFFLRKDRHCAHVIVSITRQGFRHHDD
jgi:hypothetical protein